MRRLEEIYRNLIRITGRGRPVGVDRVDRGREEVVKSSTQSDLTGG